MVTGLPREEASRVWGVQTLPFDGRGAGGRRYVGEVRGGPAGCLCGGLVLGGRCCPNRFCVGHCFWLKFSLLRQECQRVALRRGSEQRLVVVVFCARLRVVCCSHGSRLYKESKGAVKCPLWDEFACPVWSSIMPKSLAGTGAYNS